MKGLCFKSNIELIKYIILSYYGRLIKQTDLKELISSDPRKSEFVAATVCSLNATVQPIRRDEN